MKNILIAFLALSLLVVINTSCDEGAKTSASVAPTETNAFSGTSDQSFSITSRAVTTAKPAQGQIRNVDWKSMMGADATKNPFFKDVVYADYNYDGIEDALVLQMSGNSIVNAYIFTYDGSKLKKIFEHMGTYQGVYALGSSRYTFTEQVSIHSPGDQNCCPSNLKITTYKWDIADKKFVIISEQTVANPN